MIDHVGIRISDYPRSRAFYTRVLGTLGYQLLTEFSAEQTGGMWAAGFGADKPDFWIGTYQPSGPGHVAFTAPNRKAVSAFHAAALDAGGKDNGAPGLRAHYHPNYFGAFVLDPDGNNVEAVCHKAE